MRSKAESPPLGPIRTLALYREGVARGREGSGWLGERQGGREGREGREGEKKNC